LLSVSIQDIQQDPQDTSNFYLANIYQVLADPNRSNISTSLPASPPPFSPPNFAVWVNGLWFMSLVISITCAIIATLLQQWARRYLKVTQTHYSLHKRARIRTFFAAGVEGSLLPHVAAALPTLIHVSLVLFFAGLAVFLWNVNITIFKVVLSWIGVCTALYGCTMLISILCRDSPYYTPLTPLALPVILVIGWVFYVSLVIFFSPLVLWEGFFHDLPPLPERLSKCIRLILHFQRTIEMTREEAALESPAELDTRALTWTFGRLDEDHELVRFFSGLPGFHTSKVVKEPLRSLADDQKWELLSGLIGFLDRTFSSDLKAEVKCQRADLCGKVIDLVCPSGAFPEVLLGLASNDRFGTVQSADILNFVKRWDDCKDEDTTLVIHAIVSIVVTRAQQHDDPWFNLASNEMAVPEPVLRSYASHGDSLSLAIVIHIARQQFTHFRTQSWPYLEIMRVLKSVSSFDVQDTSPELQHEFCTLWNEMVRKAPDQNDWTITWYILRPLRGIYIALHQDTISAPTRFSASTSDYNSILYKRTSYPVCCVPDHTLDDTASTIFPLIVQFHDDALVTASPTSPIAPFLSLPAPPQVHENLVTVPPLDNSHPTHHTIDSLTISLTSPDPSNATAIQDAVTAGITTSYLTPETSTSAPPSSTASPHASTSLQYTADLLTPSDSPNLPSPASGPVLDNIVPTGPSLSAYFSMTQTDL
jgi:hypothetical protein